jgi:hypothetical protein
VSAPLELQLDLTAVIVAVTDGQPRVLTVPGPSQNPGLPSGPLTAEHRTLELGLRDWAAALAGLSLAYVEQLYTFGDRDRGFRAAVDATAARVLSIGYLALVREAPPTPGTAWRDWYDFFPWEDGRAGVPAVRVALQQALDAWVDAAPPPQRPVRRERLAVCFGDAETPWNEDRALERFELLYEAGLVAEAGADAAATGQAMAGDHRRMLATAMSRLRGKLRYRPVVFELLPERFTFLELQRTVEALAGRPLHKPNFRRLVEQQGLVEETDAVRTETGGRPARLFRFRREVLRERPAPGLRLPRGGR